MSIRIDGTNTTANPGITGGDADTGLQFGTDEVSIVTGGTEQVKVDSSGNVGIGTTSPQADLHIGEADGSSRDIVIHTQNNGTARLRFREGGTVSSGYNEYSIGMVGSANALSVEIQGPGEAARIDSSGRLLVGTSSAIDTTQVIQAVAPTFGKGQILVRNSLASTGKYWSIGPDSSANAFVVYSQLGGGVYIAEGATSWTGVSDERIKTNLTPIVDAVQKVSTLRAVTGRFITDEENVSRAFLIAQDVQAVLPEAVTQRDDDMGTLGIAYTDTIPLLVAAIKELTTTVKNLEAEVTALKGGAS
jgi:hypothetical protein